MRVFFVWIPSPLPPPPPPPPQPPWRKKTHTQKKNKINEEKQARKASWFPAPRGSACLLKALIHRLALINTSVSTPPPERVMQIRGGWGGGICIAFQSNSQPHCISLDHRRSRSQRRVSPPSIFGARGPNSEELRQRRGRLFLCLSLFKGELMRGFGMGWDGMGRYCRRGGKINK